MIGCRKFDHGIVGISHHLNVWVLRQHFPPTSSDHRDLIHAIELVSTQVAQQDDPGVGLLCDLGQE